MFKKRIVSLAVIVCLLSICLVQSGCDKDVNAIRQHIKDAVIGTDGVITAIKNTLQPDDPRHAKLQAFKDTLKRFEEKFTELSRDNPPEALRLFADVVTAFSQSVIPLVNQGSAVAIVIVGIDTALRLITSRLTNLIEKNKSKASIVPVKVREQIACYEKVLIDYLQSPPITAE